MKVLAYIGNRNWVNSIVDNRKSDDGKIEITLKEGFVFNETQMPSASFASIREAVIGSSRNNVINKNAKTPKSTKKTSETPSTPVSKAVSAKNNGSKKKELSMSKDAIRKRAARAAKKAELESMK